MTPNQYQQNALRTESMNLPEIAERMTDDKMIRLQHASMGLQTEVGEFTDPLKKFMFYGKQPSMVNLAEEIGDILWYCAIACDALGVTMEQVMETNINKLRDRFPDKFDNNLANNRDLNKEHQTLNEGLQPTT